MTELASQARPIGHWGTLDEEIKRISFKIKNTLKI
jgi:hypothetical protein